MAYITTTEELNKFVQTEADLDFYRVEPYLNRALRDLKKIIGKDLIDDLESEQTDSLKKEARNYICGFIANKGISLSLNILNIKVGNIGIRRQENTKTEKADWFETKDLNRDLLTMANVELNDLLAILDSSLTIFPNWAAAPYKLQYKDLLINSLEDFENHFSLNGSYTTFQSLKPFIKDAQNKYIKNILNQCFNSSDLTNDLNHYINAALVNYTIAAVCDSGLFKLENNGALIKVEVMPWEKVEVISDLRLDRLKVARLEQADLYMKVVFDEIRKLPCYVNQEIGGSPILYFDSGLAFI